MFQSGQQIGNYILLRKIGKGGFGEVWLAEKRSQLVTKKVAIKLPLEDQINLEAIRQEAELWEQASGHANVLPIIDADIIDNQVVIVSEYADGGSLHDKIKRDGKLSLEQTLEMTIGVLNGLEFLHHKRIIHRDIKPQNILLQGNTPRLADFGISRAMQTTAISSTIIGTDAYMSPESFEGKRTVQTDIWSVGVLLYSLLADKLPFPQEHPSERMFAILTKEFLPVPDDVPPNLQKIVSKALAKLPENRYQTANEMRDELQKVLVAIAHPTLARTEILHIPITNATLREEPENETIINNSPPVITQPPIPQQSIVTQFNQVQFVENKPLPTAAQEFANQTQKTELGPNFYRFGIAIFASVIALLVVIVGASYFLTPRNLFQTKTNSNVNSALVALMNIELKKLDNIPLVIKVDGRDESDPNSPPRTSYYAAQNNFIFKYGVYSVDKVQLKINGKIINLPRTPPLGDYMIHFEVTKDNLQQILQKGSNENIVSTSTVSPTPSISPTPLDMNIEFTATEPVAFFVNVDGGKEDAIILAPTMVKKFSPQKSFDLSYSPEKANIILLKINGKSISLPQTGTGKGMLKFKITKENLSEVLQSGKLEQ